MPILQWAPHGYANKLFIESLLTIDLAVADPVAQQPEMVLYVRLLLSIMMKRETSTSIFAHYGCWTHFDPSYPTIEWLAGFFLNLSIFQRHSYPDCEIQAMTFQIAGLFS